MTVRDTSLTIRVAEELARTLDTQPTDLPPIHDAVDLDAVERLVAHTDAPGLQVAFEYQGYGVRVDGDGEVEVRSRD
jgi:hypothetical protein